eukprot:5683202-Alexandrium_andersonii.AAC.1
MFRALNGESQRCAPPASPLGDRTPRRTPPPPAGEAPNGPSQSHPGLGPPDSEKMWANCARQLMNS